MLTDEASKIRLSAADEDTAIAAAKTFLLEGNGFYSPVQPSLFADDFVFRASVVGPLCKRDYLETMGIFSLSEALPDIKANAYGWCVAPATAGDLPGTTTVRVFVRNTGTHTGPLNLLNVGWLMLPPSGKSYEGTTESLAITLDDASAKVRKLTVGYVVDRFEGNGGGMGGLFGILYAIGLPVSNKPASPPFRFAQWLGNTLPSAPRSISKDEDLPAWFRDERRGSEGL